MPTRQAASAEGRRALYEGRLEAANTDRGRLWVACGWLVAEGIRAGRLREVIGAVLGLVHAVRHGQPITDRVFDSNRAVEKVGGDSPRVSTHGARARLTTTHRHVNPRGEGRGA